MKTYGEWKLDRLIENSERTRERAALLEQGMNPYTRTASQGKSFFRQNQDFTALGANLATMLNAIATENPMMANRLVRTMIGVLNRTGSELQGSRMGGIIRKQLQSLNAQVAAQPENAQQPMQQQQPMQ